MWRQADFVTAAKRRDFLSLSQEMNPMLETKINSRPAFYTLQQRLTDDFVSLTVPERQKEERRRARVQI